MEFTVDIVSAPNNRIFHQTWTNNMLHTEGPQVQYKKAAKSWIKITWKPDLEKLSMRDGIHNLVWGLLRRRVYDIAGTTHKKESKYSLTMNWFPLNRLGSTQNYFVPMQSVLISMNVGMSPLHPNRTFPSTCWHPRLSTTYVQTVEERMWLLQPMHFPNTFKNHCLKRSRRQRNFVRQTYAISVGSLSMPGSSIQCLVVNKRMS